ncbi:MAG: type II toxin-antitoxin system prevent-host-death family antitoxin [Deltaproteobacteria bacterium]|nr:type II toxin-antitoxin system prevent-host-death family antitoxin [Deltaproteobacteria bacterium]
MSSVKIANLKANLSSYLREVQKGSQIIVTDRETPIARVVPYHSTKEKLHILKAASSPRKLKKLKIPSSAKATDSLRALLKDRRDDLEN